jgi:hypothetical protein
LLQNPEQIPSLGLSSIGDEIEIEIGSRHWAALSEHSVKRA